MWGSSWTYLAFMYVAPTPGAAGLAEATAQDFFGALVPVSSAVSVALLFRGLAYYLPVGLGAVHLVLIGGLDGVVTGRPNR